MEKMNRLNGNVKSPTCNLIKISFIGLLCDFLDIAHIPTTTLFI